MYDAILVFYDNVNGLYNGATRANLATLCFIVFVLFFFFGQLVEVVEEKEREKHRGRNLNERESRSQTFFGFRNKFRR